jgi:alkaline phosphatase D
MNKIIILIAFIFSGFLLGAQTPHTVSLQSCLKPFYHGVASGDPMSDRVIIWTRVTPDSTQINQTIMVDWKIATDTGMVNVVNQGFALTDSSADFTVKVDVTGLSPNKFYYYEFKANGKYSPRGRTKTTPVGATDSLRFAMVSCANFEAGWFNVYANLLQRSDFDAVLSLGDYIYEYQTGGYSPNANVNRQWQPSNEIVTLSDYRMRYSSYHLDTDLQRLHQQFPFICVYDDHEFSNDAWMNGAQNHQGNEGPWNSRKLAAQKALFEWLPIRVTGTSNTYQIFREVKYGNLMDLFMLDTRIEGRDLQAGTSGATVTSSTRQLLGSNQLNWLKNKLDSTSCTWKVLGQQVMMAPLQVFGVGFNGDQWDGYPAERSRIYNHFLQNNISNLVVLTGDIHSSWANDLPTSTYNSSNGAGSAGVEFVTPSVTSPGLSIPLGASAIMAANGHIKYVNLSDHGYVILDVNTNRTQADWYYVNTIDNQSTSFNYAKSYYVNNFQRHLIYNNAASLPRNSIYSTLAPICPRNSVPTNVAFNAKETVIISVYPKPAYDFITLQFQNYSNTHSTVKITDVSGKNVYEEKITGTTGVMKHYLNTANLEKGIYFITIVSDNNSETFKFIKH